MPTISTLPPHTSFSSYAHFVTFPRINKQPHIILNELMGLIFEVNKCYALIHFYILKAIVNQGFNEYARHQQRKFSFCKSWMPTEAQALLWLPPVRSETRLNTAGSNTALDINIFEHFPATVRSPVKGIRKQCIRITNFRTNVRLEQVRQPSCERRTNMKLCLNKTLWKQS